MMKKILNHRDTENTEKNATRRALFIVFSVCSVPLWLIPAFSAQPPIVGRPVDFSGAIGGPFVVTMEVEPSQVAIEEPFTLTLRIVGPGNLNEIPRPALAKLNSFGLFEVDNLDDTFTDGTPPSRAFRYRLRARSEKVTQIPVFKFVYFNPAIVPPSRGYQTTYAESPAITVREEELAGSRPSNYVLPLIIANFRHALKLRSDDEEAFVGLKRAREYVQYPSVEMRPTNPWWPYWLTMRRFDEVTVGMVVIGAAAIVRWRIVRNRKWLIVSLAALSIATIPIIGSLLEWRERLRNEVAPVVILTRDTILRRGNAELYPPRIDSPLPVGAEVRRLFERNGWLQVELANGVVGWVPQEVVLE